jgi:hypothetical protein
MVFLRERERVRGREGEGEGCGREACKSFQEACYV